MGQLVWELHCSEHNIREDGMSFSDICSSFFTTEGAQKVVPRALFVDLEPFVVGEKLNALFFL